MRNLCSLGLMFLTLSSAIALGGASFPFSPEEFKTRLNKAIVNDATDKDHSDGSTIESCAKKRLAYECSFNDMDFKKSVAAMKKMDLMNGDFSQQLLLTIESDGKRVKSIRLNGSRADPANIFHFIGMVANIFQVFDPKVDNGEALKELSDNLGLMRGDDSSNIGEKMVVLKPYAAVMCLAVPSSISTGEVCVWTPRY